MPKKTMPVAELPSTGRPTIFSQQVAAAICFELATGRSLRRVCAGEAMPAESTVRNWALTNEQFGKAYREARDLGLDAMADETLDIADDGRNDTQIGEDGKEIVNYDHIQRSRVRVDTRKWYLSKLAPKRYGDSARIEHTGADGGPIRTANLNFDVAALARKDREALRRILGPVLKKAEE